MTNRSLSLGPANDELTADLDRIKALLVEACSIGLRLMRNDHYMGDVARERLLQIRKEVSP